MHNKLTLNKNYFEIDKTRVIYAMEQIKDEIARYINVY